MDLPRTELKKKVELTKVRQDLFCGYKQKTISGDWHGCRFRQVHLNKFRATIPVPCWTFRERLDERPKHLVT